MITTYTITEDGRKVVTNRKPSVNQQMKQAMRKLKNQRDPNPPDKGMGVEAGCLQNVKSGDRV